MPGIFGRYAGWKVGRVEKKGISDGKGGVFHGESVNWLCDGFANRR